MNFFTRLLRRIKMLFIHSGTDIAKAFGVELISSPEMSSALTNWDRISTGKPPWLNAEDEIGTINMGKNSFKHTGHRVMILEGDIFYF